MNNISIAIAEDNTLALKSILKKLAAFDGFTIVTVASNGKELLNHFTEHPADIVLMDIEMPVMDGITATIQLKEQYPDIKVLMLTTFDDDDKIFNAILAGASGYLLKHESAAIIQRSIQDIYQGGAAMSAGIALKTLHYIKNIASTPSPVASTNQSLLTDRETEILSELKNGLGYKQIADKLFISEGTVRKHIEHIYRKLQVNNKVSAVNKAMENKWLL